MKLIVTHGYMLSDSGSNVYVQNLCRALVRAGHEVHLLCQEPCPLDYDFVDEHHTLDASGGELRGEQETLYPGRCWVYQPDIGDLLPVYVYDDYPGWRVKTFLDLTEKEFEMYVEDNVAALQSVLALSGAKAVVTNHAVPGPLIARRSLSDTNVPYLSITHGSALQYVARKSPRYGQAAREGLDGAHHVLALSEHSIATVVEDFPELADKARALPGGVDTKLFRPDARDLGVLEKLGGGPGRGPEQAAMLRELLRKPLKDASELAMELHPVAASYDARMPDRDAGERIESLVIPGSPLVVYVGKLIHSKGVHSLLSAFARVRRQTGARLLVVGFGTFREALEALILSLSNGDRRTLKLLYEGGKLFEDGPEAPMEHFDPSEELLAESAGLEGFVEFVGPLSHAELAKLLPAADVGVVPSIFPESFGLVAAEFAASGVPSFVADHSGLREVGGIVGRGLPFDLRVNMDGFEDNLARALAEYLGRPEKERIGYSETVRRNSVEYLSWDSLADKIAGLAAG